MALVPATVWFAAAAAIVAVAGTAELHSRAVSRDFGRAEVQALWDADKESRREAAATEEKRLRQAGSDAADTYEKQRATIARTAAALAAAKGALRAALETPIPAASCPQTFGDVRVPGDVGRMLNGYAAPVDGVRAPGAGASSAASSVPGRPGLP